MPGRARDRLDMIEMLEQYCHRLVEVLVALRLGSIQ